MEFRRRNPHKRKMTLDMLHMLICVFVVLLAWFGFSDLSRRYYVFPIVFLLAGILNLVNGTIRSRRVRGEESQFVPGFLLCVLGGLLIVLAIVSAYVSIRRLQGM